MAISYINTTEVETISKELISLSSELTNEINSLFTRFSEVPTITREWVGQQSQFYFNRIANDKKQYLDFANKINEIGFKLTTDIYEIQSCIKNNINEENKKEM